MKVKSLCLVAALALVPSPGWADNGSLGPSVTGETGLFNLFSGETLPQGQWSLGFYYNNWDRVVIPDSLGPVPANFSSEWDYDWHRLSASVAYGVTDTLELSLLLPYDTFDASDNGRFGRINGRYFVNEIEADGLANLRLGAKWNAYTSADKQSHFALNGFAELATGDDDEGVATGDTGFGLGVAYDVNNWVFNLGYRDPGDPDRVDVPQELTAGAGFAARISDRFSWITEVQAIVYSSDDPQPDDNVDLTTGGRLWLDDEEKWAFNFALRTDLLQLDNTDEFCPLGGLIGLTYFPRMYREKQEAARLAAEEEARRKAEEAEAARRAAEEEARRKAEEEARRKPVPPPQPPPQPPPPPPPPPPPAIEEVCQFAANSSRVDNRCKATLDEVALRMKQEGQRIGLVIGYTDSQGTAAANQRISERRAEAVKTYLVTRHGIDPARISTEGRGDADPVGDNSTAAGRAQNRRAVIILKVQ